MATLTIGANLTVAHGVWTNTVSKGIQQMLKFMAVTQYAKDVVDYKSPKVFTKAGIPAENTAADSPGSNLCFVIDTTNSDLWLIYDWVTSTDFAVAKIVD